MHKVSLSEIFECSIRSGRSDPPRWVKARRVAESVNQIGEEEAEGGGEELTHTSTLMNTHRHSSLGFSRVLPGSTLGRLGHFLPRESESARVDQLGGEEGLEAPGSSTCIESNKYGGDDLCTGLPRA